MAISFCLSVRLFVRLSVCRLKRVHKTRFSQKLNNLELRSLLMANRKSYMGFTSDVASRQRLRSSSRHHASRRTTTSSQHARPSGVLRRRSSGLECAALRPPRPVAQCRQFQEDAKDASVSECTWTLSALEALRNALYKFKTYLLTYLLTCAPVWR